MQGFFVKTYSTGKAITLAADARTHDGIHDRYKGSAVIPLIRLKLLKKSSNLDETVVRFDSKAKTGYDLDFDANKVFGKSTMPQIYSSSEGSNYAINGQPFPETSVEIPINLNLIQDTVFSISVSQLQGLDNYNVTLKDNANGSTTNLKTNPMVSFSSSSGNVNGRFILKISNVTTAIEDPIGQKEKFNIYFGNNNINIQTVSDEWDGNTGSVKVVDMTGKTTSDLNGLEFSRNSLIRVPSTLHSGVYIVEIRSGLKRYVGKVVVK
jgi:hypothetical protein